MSVVPSEQGMHPQRKHWLSSLIQEKNFTKLGARVGREALNQQVKVRKTQISKLGS